MKKAICLFILISAAMPAKANPCGPLVVTVAAVSTAAAIILHNILEKFEKISQKDSSAASPLKLIKKCETIDLLTEEFSQMNEGEQQQVLAKLREMKDICFTKQEIACHKSDELSEKLKNETEAIAENYITEAWDKLKSCLGESFNLLLVANQLEAFENIKDNQSK